MWCVCVCIWLGWRFCPLLLIYIPANTAIILTVTKVICVLSRKLGVFSLALTSPRRLCLRIHDFHGQDLYTVWRILLWWPQDCMCALCRWRGYAGLMRQWPASHCPRLSAAAQHLTSQRFGWTVRQALCLENTGTLRCNVRMTSGVVLHQKRRYCIGFSG